MANLLNFITNRDLGFSPTRELHFDPNRDLGFDSNRELDFQPNRDLGFGKRGVLFRGYACAGCGAIVSVDATSCDECGAVFEEPRQKGMKKTSPAKLSAFGRTVPKAAAAPTAAPTPPSPATYPPPPAPVYSPPVYTTPTAIGGPASSGATSSRFCPNCGARSWSGDAFCWNCGARFTESPKVVTASPTGANLPVPPTAETVQLPPKKARKVVKDWRETGKTLTDYAEEK